MLWENSSLPATGRPLSAPGFRGVSASLSPSDMKTVPTGARVLICSPMKLAIPVPKTVSVSPVTFWLALSVTVRKA